MGCAVNALGLIGYILAIAGAALLGASMGTVFWQTPSSQVASGLFEACINSRCVSLGWSTDTNFGITLVVTRAILITCCLLWIIGFVLASVALCGNLSISVGGGIHISAGLVTLIGCITYTLLIIFLAEYGSGSLNASMFGVSFYLCYSSSALIILGGSFEACGKKSESSNQQIHPGYDQELQWGNSASQPAHYQPPTNPSYRGYVA